MDAKIETPEIKVEESSGMRQFLGPLILTRDFFKYQEHRQDLYVAGPLTICPDVPSEDIEEKLGELTVFGPLRCPEYLLPLVQPRLQSLHGPTIAYACSPTSQVVVGELTLREGYLRELEDGTELAVVGRLRVPQVLANDLLKQKVKRCYVLQTIICHEENAQALASLIDRPRKMTVIPAGFELVERSLVLSSTELDALPGKKLYCMDRVQINPNVGASLLDDRLEAIISEDIVFCPVGLQEVISRKCEWYRTQLVLYEGELWIVDDERNLQAFSLESLQGKATLVVYGELTVDSGVDDRLLTDRLDKVHNLGQIRCTPEQMVAIQGRLGMSDGDLVDSTRVDSGGEYT